MFRLSLIEQVINNGWNVPNGSVWISQKLRLIVGTFARNIRDLAVEDHGQARWALRSSIHKNSSLADIGFFDFASR